jgi:hypothetical protein
MQQSRLLLLSGVLALVGSPHASTAAAPPPPAVYDVQIHYHVDGFGKERVYQFLDMTDYFKKAGFARADEPDEREPEDPRNLPLRGTIASGKARQLLAEPHVRCIRLLPQGAKLPDDKAALVRVHLEMPSRYGAEQQQVLTEQIRRVLSAIGFKEGAVYDHRGYTRLVGAIPVGQIDTILNDLRKQEGGAKLPPPFANGPPIRVVEILPDMPQLPPRPTAPPSPLELDKQSADLRTLVADKMKAEEPLRFEAILALTPDAGDPDWKLPFRAAPGVAVEGRLGPVVTVYGPRGQVAALAARPEIVALRLPRAPRLWLQPGDTTELATAADPNSLLANLQARVRKGERAAVVDGDFRGWEALLDRFPRARVQFIDLTRERNRDLKVEPYPYPGPGTGQGTRLAEMLLKAAPAADLTLICIDPSAPFQLETVARAIDADRHPSLALDSRLADLNRWRGELDLRSTELAAQRRAVFEDFRIEGEAVENRKAYRKKQADHDCEEADYRTALSRYLHLTQDLSDLRTVRHILTGLVWDDGYPVEGAGALSRFFDDRPLGAAELYQYSPDTRGQAWVGMFRDQDRNEVMEFAPPDTPLPPGRWTRELNFLAWQPFKGARTADLPANAVIRATLQWREAHEPDLLRTGEDPYREPVANLRLALVYQPDPAGAKQPDDDLEIVAESVGSPQRIAKSLDAGVYEQAVVFKVPKAGRYAVRIVGRGSNDTRPPGVPSVPAARRTFELQPRLFVATLEGEGRAVLADYSTDAGSLGTPADARRVQRLAP